MKSQDTRHFLCDDGNAEIEISADHHLDAAQKYVDGGEWGDRSETIWIDVYTREIDSKGNHFGERERITITLEGS